MDELTQRRVCVIGAASSPVERVPSYAAYVTIGIEAFRRHEIVRSKGFNGVGGPSRTGRLRRPGVLTPPSGLLSVKVDHGSVVPTTQDRGCRRWIKERGWPQDG